MMTKIVYISVLTCISMLLYETSGQAIYGASYFENYMRSVSYLEKKIERLEEQGKTTMRMLANAGCISGKTKAWEHPVAPPWPVSKHIRFEPPFEKKPVITVGMTLLDSEHTTNVRAIIETKDISRYGFTLILTKHADSNNGASLQAGWPVQHGIDNRNKLTISKR